MSFSYTLLQGNCFYQFSQPDWWFAESSTSFVALVAFLLPCQAAVRAPGGTRISLFSRHFHRDRNKGSPCPDGQDAGEIWLVGVLLRLQTTFTFWKDDQTATSTLIQITTLSHGEGIRYTKQVTWKDIPVNSIWQLLLLLLLLFLLLLEDHLQRKEKRDRVTVL